MSGLMTHVQWLLAYRHRPEDVILNIRFASHAVDRGEWPKARVFVSDKWGGVLITPTNVEACRDPHVIEWADTMRESSVGEISAALAKVKP
jgi:hypothetical protein